MIIAYVITMLFVLYKLTGMFDVSWFWVFSPLIVYITLIFSVLIIALLHYILLPKDFKEMINEIKKKKLKEWEIENK